MDAGEVQQVLETIVELANSLGWTVVLAQRPDGALNGMHLGTPEWVELISSKVPVKSSQH